MKVCFDDKVYNSSNWTPDAMITTIPTLYTQIATQIGLSGIIFLLLKPFSQSRLAAEVIVSIWWIINLTWLFVLQRSILEK